MSGLSPEDEAQLLAAYDAISPAPVTRQAKHAHGHHVRSTRNSVITTDHPVVQTVRQAFVNERKRRADAEFRREIATLRAEIAVEKRVTQITERLDLLERSRGLRAV